MCVWLYMYDDQSIWPLPVPALTRICYGCMNYVVPDANAGLVHDRRSVRPYAYAYDIASIFKFDWNLNRLHNRILVMHPYLRARPWPEIHGDAGQGLKCLQRIDKEHHQALDGYVDNVSLTVVNSHLRRAAQEVEFHQMYDMIFILGHASKRRTPSQGKCIFRRDGEHSMVASKLPLDLATSWGDGAGPSSILEGQWLRPIKLCNILNIPAHSRVWRVNNSNHSVAFYLPW